MRNSIVLIMASLVSAILIGCTTWASLPVETKTVLACDTSVDLIKPECLRVSDDPEDSGRLACEETFEGVRTTCKAVILKDADGICPYIQSQAARCSEIFSEALDISSCQRAFVAANGICILSTAKPADPVPAS